MRPIIQSLIFFCFFSQKASSLNLDKDFKETRLKPYLLFLHQDGQSLHINDLTQQKFTALPPRGIYSSTVYAKLPSLVNKTGTKRLFIHYKWIVMFLTMYCVDTASNSLLWQKDLGYMVAPNKKTSTPGTTLEVTVPIDRPVDLYFEFKHENALNFELYLEAPEYAAYVDRFDSVLLGLYFGIIAAIFFYNLFIFLVLRDLKYLLYLAVIFFGDFVAVSIMYGVATHYFFPPAILAQFRLDNIIFSLASFFSVFFCLLMLDLKRSSRLSKLFVFYLTVIGIINFLALLPFSRFYISTVVNSNAILASIFVWISCLLLSLRGNKGALHLLIAWSAMDLSMVIAMLGIHGFIDETNLTRYCLLIGKGIEGILLSLALAYRMRQMRKENDEHIIKELKLANASALALSRTETIIETTRYFAHDIRRPYSMLKCLLQLLNRDSINHRDMIKQYEPMIQKAMEDVDSTISRVLSIGETSSVASLSSCSLREILYESLLEVFGPYSKSKVLINIHLMHAYKLKLSAFECKRVLSNIIDNARSATFNKGKIWISSEDNGDFIRCVIGNDGSSIDPADLMHLFQPYFSKNKQGGTGLGLAIVKKIIEESGGNVQCISTTNSVEFVLHFRKCVEHDNTEIKFPSQAKAYSNFIDMSSFVKPNIN